VVTVPADFQVRTDLQRVYSNHVAFRVVTGGAGLHAPIHFDDDLRLPFDAVVAFIQATKTVREADFAGLPVFGALSRAEQANETLRRELCGIAGIHDVRVRENADGLDFLVTVDVELYEAETAIIPVFQSLMGMFPDLAIEFMIASADEIGPEVVAAWGNAPCSPDET
jgi:hypothetical protein